MVVEMCAALSTTIFVLLTVTGTFYLIFYKVHFPTYIPQFSI